MSREIKEYMKSNNLSHKRVNKRYKESLYEFFVNRTSLNNNEREITLELNFDITPASRHRSGRFGNYIAQPYKSFKEIFSVFLRNSIQKNLSEGFIEVDITITFKIPKSYSKKKRDKLLNTPFGNKPDNDNIEKTIFDCLTQSGLIPDDSLIYKNSTMKMWGSTNRTLIKIKML